MKYYHIFTMVLLLAASSLLVSCGMFDNPLEEVVSTPDTPASGGATSLALDTSTSQSQENAE